MLTRMKIGPHPNVKNANPSVKNPPLKAETQYSILVEEYNMHLLFLTCNMVLITIIKLINTV